MGNILSLRYLFSIQDVIESRNTVLLLNYVMAVVSGKHLSTAEHYRAILGVVVTFKLYYNICVSS